MDLATAALLLLAVSLAVWAWGWRRRRPGRLPPGPRGLPLLGSLAALDARAPHRALAALARRWGAAFTVRLGAVDAVVLADARLVRRALEREECAGRAPLFLTHGIMGGHGIICAEGERWREQRRFVFGRLRALGMVRAGARRQRLEQRIAAGAADLVRRISDALREREEKGGEGEAALDPAPLLLHCVGNVVSGAVFGREWAEDDPTWRWLLHTQEEGTKLIGVAGAINFIPALRFLPTYRRMIQFIKDGQKKSHDMYARWAEEVAEAPMAKDADAGDADDRDVEPDEEEDDKDGPDHILGAFVAEQRRRRGAAGAGAGAGAGAAEALGFYTDEQRHHLVADLFGAGLDTTLVSLRWFLLLMAVHPDEQAKVQEELEGKVGAGRAVVLADAPALPRLRAAIAEAQRLRPVVPVGIPHGVVKDVELEEWLLPKGTMVIPLLWAIHMDESHFPEPHEYRPQRFLADDGSFTRPNAFIPFQTGKRVCVGEQMADMMLLLFGGAVLQNFELRPPRGATIDLDGECGITLAPRPHQLVFVRRHQSGEAPVPSAADSANGRRL